MWKEDNLKYLMPYLKTFLTSNGKVTVVFLWENSFTRSEDLSQRQLDHTSPIWLALTLHISMSQFLFNYTRSLQMLRTNTSGKDHFGQLSKRLHIPCATKLLVNMEGLPYFWVYQPITGSYLLGDQSNKSNGLDWLSNLRILEHKNIKLMWKHLSWTAKASLRQLKQAQLNSLTILTTLKQLKWFNWFWTSSFMWSL